VPNNVEKINDYLFIDIEKSNKMKNVVNEMNDSEMCVR